LHVSSTHPVLVLPGPLGMELVLGLFPPPSLPTPVLPASPPPPRFPPSAQAAVTRMSKLALRRPVMKQDSLLP
jgi:hypothetical protein